MRARNIKPDFFLDEDLATLPFEARILFAGLWCCADREGRLEDRPLRIRAAVFPYDNLDVDALLNALCKSGQLVRYQVNGQKCIQIKGFKKHQNPHHTEKDSILPEFNGEVTVNEPSSDGDAPPRNGSNPPDSGFLIDDPRYLITDPPISAPSRRPRAQSPGDGFEEFYSAYPRKKARAAAFKAWAKLSPDEELRGKILSALKWQVDTPDWKRDNGDYIPYPATYLNNRRWEDERDNPKQQRPVQQEDDVAITLRLLREGRAAALADEAAAKAAAGAQ